MIREIHRIEPLSAIRVGFIMGIFTGFIFGLLEGAIIKLAVKTIGSEILPPGAESLAHLSGASLLLLAIVMGLLISLFFALMAGLLAIFYNWAARIFGGFEIHMDPEATGTSSTYSDPSDHDSLHE